MVSAFSENFMLKVSGENYNKIKIHNYSSFDSIQGIVKKMKKTKNGLSSPEILGTFRVDGFDSETVVKGKAKENEYLVVSLQGEAEGKVKASLQYKNYVGYDILIIAFEDK